MSASAAAAAAPTLKEELKQSWEEEVYVENVKFSKLSSGFHPIVLMHVFVIWILSYYP